MARPIQTLIAHWGAKKTARRFRVTERTIKRWASRGPSHRYAAQVAATSKRVDAAWERARQNEEWAAEQLTRWVAAGNQEVETRNKVRDLKRKRGFRGPNHDAYVQTWEGLLADEVARRRELGEILRSKKFLRTPTGKRLGKLDREVQRYADQYAKAVESDDARQISHAWTAWERQVKRLLKVAEGLQVPGFSSRQMYTLFFS